ncbi:hypothetical protein B446_33715 [Streptomyces collinus Tu 365]|uniref:Uncharacterized protein n=1 Tax=Streptomyces collinus (strain DSM 40733 / Tue 365) TaxID=1214242 RepID=S5UVQ2_STRC3|nr:hypothetical protein B446_01575 [Streptomyces collinus Tu 365]AGS73545.1 hypothetical protein B446_33715 [Streptomyces collinus Tu 365]
MPRRRPGRVRAELPRRRRKHDDTTAIRGLSSAALAEVRRIQRQKKYLWPGSIESAMVRWRSFVHQPNRRLLEYQSDGCTEWACCGDPRQAREFLEAVILAMSRRRSRELRSLVEALDRRY